MRSAANILVVLYPSQGNTNLTTVPQLIMVALDGSLDSYGGHVGVFLIVDRICQRGNVEQSKGDQLLVRRAPSDSANELPAIRQWSWFSSHRHDQATRHWLGGSYDHGHRGIPIEIAHDNNWVCKPQICCLSWRTTVGTKVTRHIDNDWTRW